MNWGIRHTHAPAVGATSLVRWGSARTSEGAACYGPAQRQAPSVQVQSPKIHVKPAMLVHSPPGMGVTFEGQGEFEQQPQVQAPSLQLQLVSP